MAIGAFLASLGAGLLSGIAGSMGGGGQKQQGAIPNIPLERIVAPPQTPAPVPQTAPSGPAPSVASPGANAASQQAIMKLLYGGGNRSLGSPGGF